MRKFNLVIGQRGQGKTVKQIKEHFEQFPRLSEEIEKFRRSTEEHLQSDPVISPLDTVHEIGILQATQIIHDYSPIGCYWCVNGAGKFVAIDNRTGNAWCEEFETKEEALEWLQGK